MINSDAQEPHLEAKFWVNRKIVSKNSIETFGIEFEYERRNGKTKRFFFLPVTNLEPVRRDAVHVPTNLLAYDPISPESQAFWLGILGADDAKLVYLTAVKETDMNGAANPKIFYSISEPPRFGERKIDMHAAEFKHFNSILIALLNSPEYKSEKTPIKTR